MTDALYLGIFRLFRFFVLAAPWFLQKTVLSTVSYLAFLIDKKHRKIIRANLDFAFGDKMSPEQKRSIELCCYKNLLFNLVDFIKNSGITKDGLSKKVTVINGEIAEDAIKKYGKAIFITGHYGNWELCSLYIGAFLSPITIVGRKLDSKAMDEVLTKNREQLNVQLLDKHGAMRGLVKALSTNRSVGILVDQNTADDEGLLVDFFCKEARHTPVASVLSRRYELPIIPLFVGSDDFKNFTVKFYEPIMPVKTDDAEADILSMTKAQANATEKAIRERPQEWFWFHKRWKNQYEHIYNF